MRKNFGPQTWLYPMPVFIIATYDEHENPDAMNAAWGGIVDQGYVGICLSSGHKTTQNILMRKAFTISIADVEHILEADYVGIVSAHQNPNKMKNTKLNMIKSDYVDAPIIQEFPMALECEYVKTTEEGLLIGKIINVSTDEAILDANGKINPLRFKPITFDPVNNQYIVLGEVVGKAFLDGTKLK